MRLKKIVCVHLGARAHYLVPKALQSKGILAKLITDTWVSLRLVRFILSKIPLRLVKSFASRYAAEIPTSTVSAFSLKFLFGEFWLRNKFKGEWQRIIARNDLFQREALKVFKKLPHDYAVFGLSYTAKSVFEIAKQNSQKTILFQVDPGLKEEIIVLEVVKQNEADFPTIWEKAPRDYWDEWRAECRLADVIMVNSDWSKVCLLDEGIAAEKIRIVGLPFQLAKAHFDFKKKYPEKFDDLRPMRCLFLGTLTLRKGIHLLLQAASRLAGQPIEFILVGNSELGDAFPNHPNVFYKGVATRAETAEYYKNTDVFLFPTLSDGFGLTQLEAMAWQLPVIASTYCGKVVDNGINGIVLPNCGVDELVNALISCLTNPATLADFSSKCLETVNQFSLEKFADELSEIIK